MKLKPVADGAGHRVGYSHWCPGCKERHIIYTESPNGNGARWAFDGNQEAPTFSPSIHCQWRDPDGEIPDAVCHYFIRGGMIEFCGDSTHDLAAQTVPLPDLPSDG